MFSTKAHQINGRSTLHNPKVTVNIAQSEKPCLYEIPYDTSDPANRFFLNREDTVTLEKESRSKLNKDTVKPYDYRYQNSLYEIFKPPSKSYLDQLERAKEVRKTMVEKRHLLGTSFNGQKQQRIDLNADALYNAKQENLRVWLQKMLISKKPVPECSGLVLHQMTSAHNRSELGIHVHNNEPSSSKLVPKVVPTAVKTNTSRQRVGNYYSTFT
ncbi:hypothetical protein Tco_0522598 [Tanacetum coccineum]